MTRGLPVILSLDVGGSAIKSGLVSTDGSLIGSPARREIDSRREAGPVLEDFAEVLRDLSRDAVPYTPLGVGVAMPGPFDYARGISRMSNHGKFDSLHGINLAQELTRRVPALADLPWRWINDAAAFALGELRYGAARHADRALFLTLGTGCGSAFAVDGKLIDSGEGVPENGYVYPLLYRGTRIDDLLSHRGVSRLWSEVTGSSGETLPAAEIARLAAEGDEDALETFRRFGTLLARSLAPVYRSFRPRLVVLGGQVSRGYPFFAQAAADEGAPPLVVAHQLDSAALQGAASALLERVEAR